ncbi:MAG: LCP family protein [Candidatus Kapabacteria bacterium]|nr:LCP family protein [Candidatus Kapabacteria bacterium]
MTRQTKNKKTNRAKFWSLIAIVLISAFVIFWFLFSTFFGSSEIYSDNSNRIDTAKQREKIEKFNREFLAAATTNEDTTINTIRVSSPENLNIEYDKDAGKNTRRIYTGRRINIAITGLDSRLGTRSNHADANHILSILIDSGKIEITSIPRDTYADAGMDDSTGLNKLTIVRANRGRNIYHQELAKIAGLDKIHYYVELGFSQAMGLIDFLGFRDSKSTLQVLRSRTGLGGDDYQRCYNQGQFIRQMILRHYDILNGPFSQIVIRGGLALIETNLTADVMNNIVNSLTSKGFPRSDSDVEIRVRPPIPINYKIYNFSDETVIASLTKKIENFNRHREDDTSFSNNHQINVERRLNKIISEAAKDSLKRPKQVINKLEVYFEQKAWHQIDNRETRNRVRDQIAKLLEDAYIKTKNILKANRIREAVEAEKLLFEKSLRNQ